MIDARRRDARRDARPADAMALVMAPERLRFACDPFLNPAWKKASQLSSGVDGLLASEAFHGSRAVDGWVVKLENALRDGIDAEHVALKVQQVPKLEPWESFALPNAPLRNIVVRGILGRCVSNHLASILQETSEAHLPMCAIAYRLGNRDAVHAAILEVATAFGINGYRYWAKLDVRDCFNSLRRSTVGSALQAMGYPDKFISLVMASVGAPRYRRVQGRLVKQNSERGCPAGLPESAILLNVLFAALDRELEQAFPGLIYRRYSDDFLLLGKTAREVELAVARLLNWVSTVGLSFKGVSPNQPARGLVKDIQASPVVFLGAELRQDGRIRIPTGVLEGQFAKVRYLLDRAARHSDLVCSHSRYAESARRTAGVATHDSNDVRASIAGFHRYWADLDQGEARIFLARASIEFPVNSMTGAGPYRKLWVAALGAPEDLSGGGDTAAQEDTSTPLEGWIRAEVLPLIRGALSGTSQGPSWETSGEIEDLDLVGTSDPDEGGLEQAHHGWGRRTNEEAVASWSTPSLDAPLGPSGNGSDVNELVGLANSACGFSAIPRGPADGRQASGITAPGSALPPGEPRVPVLRLMLLAHEYDPVGKRTRVWMDDFSDLGQPLGTWSMTFEDMPPEIAVLEHLLARLRHTAGQRVVVAMRSAWLAKLLTQHGREPRSLSIFKRLQELHQLGQRVAIVGPVRAPDCSADDDAIATSRKPGRASGAP